MKIGREFSIALASYKRASPNSNQNAPKTLDELLHDPRFPGNVRHLRKLYADPLTGNTQWGIIRDEQNGSIMGIYSLSSARPIKVAGFDERFGAFDTAKSYRDWIFSAVHSSGSASSSAVSKEKFISPLALMEEDDTDSLVPDQTPPLKRAEIESSSQKKYISPLELIGRESADE